MLKYGQRRLYSGGAARGGSAQAKNDEDKERTADQEDDEGSTGGAAQGGSAQAKNDEDEERTADQEGDEGSTPYDPEEDIEDDKSLLIQLSFLFFGLCFLFSFLQVVTYGT